MARNKALVVVFPREMSDELGDALREPQSPSEALEEQGFEPEIMGRRDFLPTAEQTLAGLSVIDYAAAVIAEQIENLRYNANELDRQYQINVRGRKIKFTDRVDYVSIREKIASKIVCLVEKLRAILSPHPPVDSSLNESGGNMSWNPDDDRGREFSQTTQWPPRRSYDIRFFPRERLPT